MNEPFRKAGHPKENEGLEPGKDKNSDAERHIAWEKHASNLNKGRRTNRKNLTKQKIKRNGNRLNGQANCNNDQKEKTNLLKYPSNKLYERPKNRAKEAAKKNTKALKERGEEFLQKTKNKTHN